MAGQEALRRDANASILQTTTDSLPANTEALYNMAIRSALSQALELNVNQRTHSPQVAVNMLRRVATKAVMIPQSREFTSNDVKQALVGHEDEVALWAEFLDDKDRPADAQVPIVKTLEVGQEGLQGDWSFQFKQ